MFRYYAMALEADFDEFGYTDASDIEIESEILELGDDYEAPEPEFRRQVQAEFREVPPRSVPLSHPAVLAADMLPPLPSASEGLMGLPTKSPAPTKASPPKQADSSKTASPSAKKSAHRPAASRPEAKAPAPAAPASKPGSAGIPKPHGEIPKPVSSKKASKSASVATSTSANADVPRKNPAKEQIAPLAGNKGSKAAPVASKPKEGNGKSVPVRPAKDARQTATSTNAPRAVSNKVAPSDSRKSVGAGNGAVSAKATARKPQPRNTAGSPAKPQNAAKGKAAGATNRTAEKQPAAKPPTAGPAITSAPAKASKTSKSSAPATRKAATPAPGKAAVAKSPAKAAPPAPPASKVARQKPAVTTPRKKAPARKR